MQTATRFRLKANVRRLNRLRWYRKYRNLVEYGALARISRGEAARYVLLDPEVGDFSYKVTNLAEVARFVATLSGADEAAALAAVREAGDDAVLRTDLDAHGRPDLLHQSPSIGPRIIWYALVRLRRPALIVETGVWYGMGAAVLLRALERNAQEGHPGELWSFDIDPTAGWLVPERHGERWRLIYRSTEAGLADELDGRDLALFITDTPSDYERERTELEIAARHAPPGGSVLVCGNGHNTPALAELASDWQVAVESCEVTTDHWFVPRGVTAVRLPGA